MKKQFLILFLLLLVGSVSAYTDFPWTAQQDVFFWNASSDISGYRIMDHIPELAPQNTIIIDVSSTNSPQQIGTWVTPVGSPGVTYIAPGMFLFNTYVETSSVSGSTTIKYNVINRSASGIETDLFYGTAITQDINTGEPTLHQIAYARRNGTTLFPGDRLIIRATATTSSPASRTLTYYISGNTNASMVSISYFTGGFENYAYSPSSATPLSAWIVVAITAVALFMLAFYFKLRDENGEISKERIIFSIASTTISGITAYLSLEIIIPSGGLATSVVYQEPVIAVLFTMTSIISFANLIYCVMQPDILKPDNKDYRNNGGNE